MSLDCDESDIVPVRDSDMGVPKPAVVDFESAFIEARAGVVLWAHRDVRHQIYIDLISPSIRIEF